MSIVHELIAVPPDPSQCSHNPANVSNLLSAWSFGAINVNMGYWRMPLEERRGAAERLGRVLERELTYDENQHPNITPDLLRVDPALERLEHWIREVASAMAPPQEAQ